jgi:hypothetical protein
MVTSTSRVCLLIAFTYLDIFALGGSPVSAQVDPSKALVGTWQGSVDVRRDRDRTLIIKSVKPTKNSGWVADGHYGTTGKGLARAKIGVLLEGEQLVLDFITSADNPAKLKLSGDRVLDGTLSVREGTGIRSDRKLRLEKASEN